MDLVPVPLRPFPRQNAWEEGDCSRCNVEGPRQDVTVIESSTSSDRGFRWRSIWSAQATGSDTDSEGEGLAASLSETSVSRRASISSTGTSPCGAYRFSWSAAPSPWASDCERYDEAAAASVLQAYWRGAMVRAAHRRRLWAAQRLVELLRAVLRAREDRRRFLRLKGAALRIQHFLREQSRAKAPMEAMGENVPMEPMSPRKATALLKMATRVMGRLPKLEEPGGVRPALRGAARRKLLGEESPRLCGERVERPRRRSCGWGAEMKALGMELLEQGRRLLRALDANHDGRLSVEECAHLKESAWLFPDEGSFQAVLDPLDCNLVDADLLWSLISDRLERDSEAGREWLQSQWRHLRLRRAPTAGDFSPVCSRSIGLTRTYTKLPTSPGSIGRAWQGFCDALPLDEILSAFKSLSGHLRAGCRHLGVYRKLVERIPTLAIPRFQKQLDSGEAPLDLRLALLGAGPIGLRAALELALLGAQVHVFELRNSFSRMNILKLWDWAALELLSLGAKDLLPNFLSYMDHIGIRELQALLLKLCLLAGVSFHWRRGFKEMAVSSWGCGAADHVQADREEGSRR
ncbi:unnamed protein product [Effrenium voratum]|nr:unnamed protein product [Effrenium voratum]